MKFLCAFVSGLCLAVSAPALASEQRHPSPVAVVAEPVPADPARPALWKISDPDTTIYLFGTVHVLRPDEHWFDGKIAEAADSSDELVTEIGDIQIQDVAAVVSELGLLPSDQSLRTLMSEADRTAYEASLAQIGLPLDVFDRSKPWYAANTLLLMQLQQAKMVGANGPETFLAERFAARSKPRIPLETIRFQLGLFNDLPQDTQLRYLRDVVDGGNKVVDEVQRVADEWRTGQAETLAAELNADSDDPAMLQHLLIDRNHTWAQWIRHRLDQPGTVFMAVGSGHLAGQGSVPDQLAALGLTVTRVQ